MGAFRPTDWLLAFSVQAHLLGWLDHRTGALARISKRLLSDDEIVFPGIFARHTLLEVYEGLGADLTAFVKRYHWLLGLLKVKAIQYLHVYPSTFFLSDCV